MPKTKLPATDFIKPQGRFRHLFAPGSGSLLEAFQEHVDRQWDALVTANAANPGNEDKQKN